MTSKVSVTVPIWFGLIKIALAANSLTPFFKRIKLVNLIIKFSETKLTMTILIGFFTN